MAGSSNYPEAPIENHQASGPGTISALFPDARQAQGAIRELRDIGIRADSISVITRDEDRQREPDPSGASGVAHEDVEREGITSRASNELPNWEDLPTTNAQMIGEDTLTALDDAGPPDDEPYLDVDRMGLSRDSGMIRRVEAQSNADEDIYTDFPDQPGGLNPDSPAAGKAAAQVQEPVQDRTGAGLGSVAGLLVGLAGLTIPGVGPFLAAGPLAGALGGLLAGGATGGIIGALSTVGVPEEYAREYASSIEQGQTLVSIRTDALSRDPIERVLTAHGGERIH